jgi:hypothetical protein
MSNSFLNWLVKESSAVINDIIKKMLPKVSSAVDAEVEKINQMIAKEGPYDFDVSILGNTYPLNLTMTSAPFIGGDLIQFYMDGQFDLAPNMTDTHKFPKEVNNEWPHRFEHSHSEQFYIHESMFNSLFRLLDDSYFPHPIGSHNIVNAMRMAFPEIAAKYGSDYTMAINMTMIPNNTATPIRLSQESGIVMGGQDTIAVDISLICSNASVKNIEEVVFRMNLEAQANFSMADLVFYPTVDDVFIHNAAIKRTHIKLQPQDLDQLFSRILKEESTIFNEKWAQGWSIANIDPALAMLTGLLKNTTLSPYVMDHFMYGGFGMQADLPTSKQGTQELTFIQ